MRNISGIRDMLELVEGQHLLEEVDVKVLKDYGRVEVGEGKGLELRAGLELKIPRWLAKKLEHDGIVEIIGSESMSYSEITKYAFLESQSSPAPLSLVKLPKDFYIRLRSYLRSLEDKIRETGDNRIYGEYEKARTAVLELVGIRLRKILLAAQMGVKLEEVREKLAYEEETLYSLLKNLVEEWKVKTTLIREV